MNIENLNILFPSKDSTKLEKIRFLLPEMESLMKKYKIFVEDGIIDTELLSISSTPCRIQDIPSLNKNKYVYGVDEKIDRIMYYFFSDQSRLFFVVPYKDKHKSLFTLLTNENIKLKDLESYQLPFYQQLMDEQYLVIEDDCVRINKGHELAIFKELCDNEVISYNHLSSSFKTVVDNLHSIGQVEFGNTLFSKSEISYLNYSLNKSEYTNGRDLRNKYAHGTHHTDQNIIENDYYWILILLILLEWKIIDDINLS